MSAKTQARRAALRETVIDLAEAQVKAGGLSALRTRNLAQQAGCSVGALYGVVDGQAGLVDAVNRRTFARLGKALSDSARAVEGATPKHRLVAFSLAYLDFAAEDTPLWRALFDAETSDAGQTPPWYQAAFDGLCAHITPPLAELNPDLDAQALALLTRGVFSAVHGMVLLGLEPRFAPTPRSHLEEMIAQVLNKMT